VSPARAQMPLNVAVLGASGNVGRLVVRHLLAHGDDVVGHVATVNRRVVEDDVFPHRDPRLVHHVVDMRSAAALEAACAPILAGVDVVCATMGIGSGKGTLEQFRTVEVELPSAFARAAATAGVRRATLLTGVGADVESTSSWLVGGVAEGQFFHLKGVVEQNFGGAGFTDGLAIFRPGGLLGTGHLPAWVDRVLPLLDWMAPARFRCIHIHQLACAMARVVIEPTAGGDGVTIFEGKSLFALLAEPRTRGPT
jgi:uncharacterized protein YbjT (DUF2867 family)